CFREDGVARQMLDARLRRDALVSTAFGDEHLHGRDHPGRASERTVVEIEMGRRWQSKHLPRPLRPAGYRPEPLRHPRRSVRADESGVLGESTEFTEFTKLNSV